MIALTIIGLTACVFLSGYSVGWQVGWNDFKKIDAKRRERGGH